MRIQSLVRQTGFLDGERAKMGRAVRELPGRVEPLVTTIPGVPYPTGGPDRRRDRRHRQVPQRLGARGPRGAQLIGQPVGEVRQRGRPRHQARVAVPAQDPLAGGEQGPARRPVPQGLLREEETRGRAPPRGGDGRRAQAPPHSLRGDAGRGPVRPGEAGRDPSKHPVSGSQGAAANECGSAG